MRLASPRSLLGRDLRGDLAAEVRGRSELRTAAGPVTESDLDGLPEPVQRYLDFMRVVGRPRDESLVARFRGRIRQSPTQRFMPFDAWQYNTRTPIMRLMHMRLDVAGFIPLVGGDTYAGGVGRMRGKLLGLVPVVDGHGREFDIGELSTWVNDAVLLAPSMLLSDAVCWSEVDGDSFDLAVSDAGRTVRARVAIDGAGAPTNFSTTDRYAALPGGLVQAEWTTPISGWRAVHGRRVPDAGSAVWHLEDGPFTYIEGEFDVESIRYNVMP